ncbi:hypothetical protein AHA02nite_26470 [Alkalibacillus haloalkaliphilus]|uniref:Uncharacterized protein n=1 Tax=Alkalibacillus haloalkaliphilus TaxID=94136 RepID=A0A511W836_9BACI|nr:hypothetical protein AHA02nite_26470 [Alkalibacillus haloalkaliphilus]
MIRKAEGAIVYKGNEFLLVHKVKVSALEKGSLMEGEWDFPKGGVEQNDLSLEHAILRELEEETGSTQYRVIKQFDDKICFSFGKSFQEQTGWKKQETTIFLVEYFGDDSDLVPKDREIAEVNFLPYEEVYERLTHKDTKQYFKSFFNEKLHDCVLCYPDLEPEQQVVFANDHCMFLQLNQSKEKGVQLEGSGLIVPRKHRETAFDLTREEWEATYDLLHKVKEHIDQHHHPQGYNVGWNCGEVGGQHIFHAHLHVLPRYESEPLSGKGIRYLFKSKENKRA